MTDDRTPATGPDSATPVFEPKGDLPHKPADDREEIYYEGSPLLRGDIPGVLGWWLLGLIIIAVPIVYWVYKGYPGYIFLLIAWVVGLAVATIPLIKVKMLRYRISNYRVDYERGLLSRRIDTLELWHVEDISMHQSLLDRILGVGTVTIVSHDDTTPKLVVKGVPSPRPLFETLKQRVIAVKRQRGVIKMDMGGDLTPGEGN